MEKRKEHRIKARLPIKISFPGQEIKGRTSNLSRLGAYVEINKEVPPGTALDITLTIPNYARDLSLSGEVKCTGSVFRCGLESEENSRKYYGIGIFFTGFVSTEDRDKLSRYIDFLILEEEKGIKKGVREWEQKRARAGQDKYDAEILKLLRETHRKLDEIKALIKKYAYRAKD